MGTFEFENPCSLSNNICAESKHACEECIIAHKIFDQCRQQKCLTPSILGPARVAKTVTNNCNEILREGDIIVPPCNATSVSIKDLELCNIIITGKKANPFRPGFWDIDLKYIFRYTLIFKATDCTELCCICATNFYNTKVTLFGSSESDIFTATDLYSCQESLSSGPFVNVEGKAISLSAELKYSSCNRGCGCNCGCGCDCDCDCGCGCDCDCGCDADNGTYGAPTAVLVTIGLFTIIKMFRPVNIVIQSLGYCVPEECKSSGTCPDNPCDFFNSIEFPMNLFSPTGTGDYMHQSCNQGCGCSPASIPCNPCSPCSSKKSGCGCDK